MLQKSPTRPLNISVAVLDLQKNVLKQLKVVVESNRSIAVNCSL